MYKSICVVVLAVIALFSPPAWGANMVVNPGFETGDLSGWTFTPAASGSLLSVSGGGHLGSYGAWFGGLDAAYYDTIFQDIATTPGETYIFSFWLASGGGVDQQAWVNGNMVLDLKNATSWTQYAFYVTATGTSTPIAFSGNSPPSFSVLDDVYFGAAGSEAGTPEPATWLPVAAALLSALVGRKRTVAGRQRGLELRFPPYGLSGTGTRLRG